MDVRQVPVIDIGALVVYPSDAEVDATLQDTNSPALRGIITSVRAAASEWGFFYIANDGLPHEEVEKFKDAMRLFFRLLAETKRAILRHATNRGYVQSELTKNKTD
ncbi:hypothetical protein PHYSODRAFT_255268 [Phytophthora sojae]|uniref:Non-haem dioxygenase N-terminal domain-containing protein n=1 Tax=Phytophthora sojae (strain P6497) TaxID=1094619 RepID=G4YP35_PHYSP|nr:hypothetical protein PHYSODRAFT_255268 [Phytophthora sojae]EGZ26744.1 hypothetical protein PHYSODRAFT_255268 [Phytophthora sojae]|eukprot:XP_009514019.1 hypothetical protein PHYSODRAFT_255268 [Phytophthora sojae]